MGVPIDDNQSRGALRELSNHEHPEGFASFAELQHAAAVDRLTCYRTYCEHVPEDAAPQMTSLYIAKQHTPRQTFERSSS